MLSAAGHTVARFEVSNDAIPAGWGKCLFFFKTIWNRRSARAVREAIRRGKPDVAHFHNTFPLISPAAYHACAAEGVPVVQTLHNFRYCCLNAYLLRDAKVCELCLGKNPWRGVVRKCYRDSYAQSFAVWAMLTTHRALGTYSRKVDAYIALTEFGKRKFVEAGLPEEKIYVKGNAVAGSAGRLTAPVFTSGYREASRRTLLTRHPPDQVVLYVGRLSPEKGPDVLVEAWKNSNLNARLVIIGDGPERAALEKQAAGLSGVTFAGTLTAPQVADWMRRATVLVIPSVCYETFSLTLNEAAAAGLPVVASDLGAFAACVKDGETGFLFPPGDAAALARVLSDPSKLRAVGENARRAFLAGESVPEKNVARLLEIYKKAKDIKNKKDT